MIKLGSVNLLSGVFVPSLHTNPYKLGGYMLQEVFKKVIHSDCYEVSSYGRLRSLKCKNPKFLNGGIDSGGYKQIGLTINGKLRMFLMHRLVLESFVGVRPKGMECCHNNGDKLNNHLDNIRWDSPENNMLDKMSHGNMKVGENSTNSKFTNNEALEIINQCKKGANQSELARKYGVCTSTINRMYHGGIWKCLRS